MAGDTGHLCQSPAFMPRGVKKSYQQSQQRRRRHGRRRRQLLQPFTAHTTGVLVWGEVGLPAGAPVLFPEAITSRRHPQYRQDATRAKNFYPWGPTFSSGCTAGKCATAIQNCVCASSSILHQRSHQSHQHLQTLSPGLVSAPTQQAMPGRLPGWRPASQQPLQGYEGALPASPPLWVRRLISPKKNHSRICAPARSMCKEVLHVSARVYQHSDGPRTVSGKLEDV